MFLTKLQLSHAQLRSGVRASHGRSPTLVTLAGDDGAFRVGDDGWRDGAFRAGDDRGCAWHDYIIALLIFTLLGCGQEEPRSKRSSSDMVGISAEIGESEEVEVEQVEEEAETEETVVEVDPEVEEPQVQPGDLVAFIDLPAFNSRTNSKWGRVLTDIVQHEAPRDSNNYSDLVTLGHETSHGIHSYIRNKMNNSGVRSNGFYVLNNKAVLIEEPAIRKRDVASYVPGSLRGSRFDLYITGSAAWDDTPLYVWDEWIAYTNGGDVAVDLEQHDLWSYGWRDGVAGQLEFSVYALALAMAVKDLDPDYFENNTQFKEFLAWNLKRAFKGFLIGKDMEPFTWTRQDSYYQNLLHNSDAEELRQFAVELFGADWIEKMVSQMRELRHPQ